MGRAVLLVTLVILGCGSARNSAFNDSCARKVADVLVEVLGSNEIKKSITLDETRARLSKALRSCPDLDVLERPMFGPFTRLDIAILAWDIEMVEEVLVNLEAEPTHELSSSPRGIGPLHNAAAYGNPTIINRLVSAGFSVDASDEVGWTPLIWAMGSSGSPEDNLKALVVAGADILLEDESGWTALDQAVLSSPPDLKKLRILVSHISLSDKRAADALANTREFAEKNGLDEAIEIIDAKLNEKHDTQE